MKKHKKLKTFLIVLFLLGIVSGILAFIYLNNPDSVEKSKKKKIKKEKVEKKVQIVDLDSDARPYAVMINNISTVWGYQTGIQDAYLVYEIIVEGGYTRLMAIFKDKSLERIGSVRSSRHYFLDYALENDAIYVHFGWSPQAQSDISSLGVDNINFLTYGKGYIRDRSLNLASEHTAFTSTDKIMNAASDLGYSKKTNQNVLLNYSADEININNMDENIQAKKIDITYSNNRSTNYEYDEQNKVYKRFQNNREHTDYETKKQYTVKNIIVYKVKNYMISGDEKHRQDIENIGSGEGYYITNGYAVPIKWNKQTRSTKTRYTYLDGTEITVNDGNTFIQIMPENQNLVIE